MTLLNTQTKFDKYVNKHVHYELVNHVIPIGRGCMKERNLYLNRFYCRDLGEYIKTFCSEFEQPQINDIKFFIMLHAVKAMKRKGNRVRK